MSDLPLSSSVTSVLSHLDDLKLSLSEIESGLVSIVISKRVLIEYKVLHVKRLKLYCFMVVKW